MDLQKIKEGWQKFLKGNKANHKAAESVDDDIESDEAKDKAEEETAKAIAKENDDLSKVKMTSGSRDKTYGINKKIVNLSMIFVVLVVVVAFLYKSMDSRDDTSSQTKNPTQQEETANDNLRSNNSAPLDYKDPNIVKLTQAEQNAQGTQKRPAQNAETANSGRQTANTQTVAAAPRVSATSTPAIPRANVSYSQPYTLPSAVTAQQPVQQAVRQEPAENKARSEAERQQEQKEKELADRFKSAISFAIGDGSSTSGSTDGAETTGTVSSASSSNTYAEPSGNVLQAGTTIPVMLYSGINTDTAGQVTAQVQADVYDSATSTNLLIPAGSRIIGGYEQGANESGRVNVTFSTIVLPNGGSYSIGDSMVAVDGQGYNGIQGKLHRHTAAQIGHGILNSAITALSTISVDRVTFGQDALRNLTASDVQPTITVEPGYEFNVYVTKAISFSN